MSKTTTAAPAAMSHGNIGFRFGVGAAAFCVVRGGLDKLPRAKPLLATISASSSSPVPVCTGAPEPDVDDFLYSALLDAGLEPLDVVFG